MINRWSTCRAFLDFTFFYMSSNVCRGELSATLLHSPLSGQAQENYKITCITCLLSLYSVMILLVLLSGAKLKAIRCRWVTELADFHFTIWYHQCKENVDADSLSQMPKNVEEMMGQCTGELVSDCVAATTQASSSPWVCPGLTPLQWTAVTDMHMMHKPFSVVEIRQAQQDDKSIGPIM